MEPVVPKGSVSIDDEEFEKLNLLKDYMKHAMQRNLHEPKIFLNKIKDAVDEGGNFAQLMVDWSRLDDGEMIM